MVGIVVGIAVARTTVAWLNGGSGDEEMNAAPSRFPSHPVVLQIRLR